MEGRQVGSIQFTTLGRGGKPTFDSGGRAPDIPSKPGNSSRMPTATAGPTRRMRIEPPAGLNPESSPTFRHLRELLARGAYAEAVRLAYRTAFDATVRAYGLTVPPSCSDRRFLREFLRPDMGPLTEVLPELYRRYEPVRFGRLVDGDRDSLRALLERLYSETPIARIHNPLYQPSGPGAVAGTSAESDLPFQPRRQGDKS
jgi:hypothetical protein